MDRIIAREKLTTRTLHVYLVNFNRDIVRFARSFVDSELSIILSFLICTNKEFMK